MEKTKAINTNEAREKTQTVLSNLTKFTQSNELEIKTDKQGSNHK